MNTNKAFHGSAPRPVAQPRGAYEQHMKVVNGWPVSPTVGSGKLTTGQN